MLTVLVKEVLGGHQIMYTAESVEWMPPIDDAPAALKLIRGPGLDDIWVECAEITAARVAYVMNDAGQTVATYAINPPE